MWCCIEDAAPRGSSSLIRLSICRVGKWFWEGPEGRAGVELGNRLLAKDVEQGIEVG